MSSVTWENYGSYVIKDINPKEIGSIVEFVLKNYVERSGVHEVLNIINDETIKQEYRKIIEYILRDSCSLAVKEKPSNTLIGVILIKLMLAEFRPWAIIRLFDVNPKIRILSNLTRSIVLEHYNEIGFHQNSLHIFGLAVEQSHMGENWKVRLLQCAYRVASSMKIPYLTFVAMLKEDQLRAEQAGLIETSRIFYASYKDEKNVRPFTRTVGKEFYAVFYKQAVVPAVPFDTL